MHYNPIAISDDIRHELSFYAGTTGSMISRSKDFTKSMPEKAVSGQIHCPVAIVHPAKRNQYL